MNTQLQRPTAKIYAFPVGGRPPTNRQRGTMTKAYLPQSAEGAPKIVCGSGWYHEAAVDETWER